jgi:GNAT superfamily N-acetyltransferase
MPRLSLAMSREEFDCLPRNGGYDYRYEDDAARLTPNVVYYRARLHFRAGDGPAPLPPDPRLTIRKVTDSDWPVLTTLFADAFEGMQPFGSLASSWRHEVAGSLLAQTREGGDGPFLADASFVAWDRDERRLGALLVTLVPEQNPKIPDTFVWHSDPPQNAVLLRKGRPHLTWVFVAADAAGRGVGTRLLIEAIERLRAAGFGEIVSTFIRGNEVSGLWHWRNGFRLLPRDR